MNNRIKKAVFDGNNFYLKNNREILQIEFEKMPKLGLKNMELIVTENIYSFETMDIDLSEKMNNQEIIQYFIWKMKLNKFKQLFTIEKIENRFFGFIIDESNSEKIRKLFGKKIKSVRPFVFTIYDKLIKQLEPASILVIDFGNLTDFLVIGEKAPFFLRKKYDLGEEEKLTEIMITKKFIKKNYNIELNKVYSNTMLKIESFILIEEEPLKIVL